MEETTKAKSNMSVPAAIVVAGVLIAGAVYFSRAPVSVPTTPPAATQPTQTDITIRPVSNTDNTLGNPSAALAMVVYTDFECPFCKEFHTTMTGVANTYGKNGSVLWVYRDFPLSQLHSRAPKEAEAAECASKLGGKQTYWSYVNEIFQTTTSNNTLDPAELPIIATKLGLDKIAFNNCLSSGTFTQKVQKDYEEAVNAGGRGTPFTVFVLPKTMSDSTATAISNIIATYNLPSDIFAFSTDKYRISMSGALPLPMVQKVIDVLLANS